MLKTFAPLYDLLSLEVSGEISQQPTVIQLILPATCQISLAQLNAVDSLHMGVCYILANVSFSSTVLTVLMDDHDHSHRFLFVNTETVQ